jgi:hypothetical protein
MDIKNSPLKASLTVAAMAVASLLTASFAQANTQNEIQVRAIDFEGIDDTLYGGSFTRYTSTLKGNSGAYLINPYLQRVSSFSGGYNNIDGTDIFTLGTTLYLNKEWMMSIDGTYAEFDYDFGDSDSTDIDVKVGYNLSREWQVGAGFLYSEQNFNGIIDGERFSGTENDNAILAFTRYTTVGKSGTGWDLLAEYISDDADVIRGSARYFFNPGLSVAGTYAHINAPGGFENGNEISVEVDYWLNEQFSVKAGYQRQVDSDIDADVLSLGATYRF